MQKGTFIHRVLKVLLFFQVGSRKPIKGNFRLNGDVTYLASPPHQIGELAHLSQGELLLQTCSQPVVPMLLGQADSQ